MALRRLAYFLHLLRRAENSTASSVYSTRLTPPCFAAIENFVKGTTYHVDGFIQDGKIVAAWPSICINHCVDLQKGAYVAHHHLNPQNPMVKKLNNYAKSVLKVFPIPKSTAFLLEVFHNEESDEIIFCEIASRVGGGVKEMWPQAFDIDLENEFIRAQSDLKPSFKLIDFFGNTEDFRGKINAITGWIIFPKSLDVLKSIPEVTPFSWVKEYIVRAQPKKISLPSKNVSDSLASAFIVSDSEKQFKERAELLNTWLQQNCQWEKTTIPQAVVKCIEDCEETIKQVEKVGCVRAKEFIKIQEEFIEKQKTNYSHVSCTQMEDQNKVMLPLYTTSQSQNNHCSGVNKKDKTSLSHF